MQEENFEKKVQKKMEELSFTPSDPVWQKIEAQIRKKKERRRLIFWLLPFLLLTGIAIVWLSGSDQQAAPQVNKQDNEILHTEKNDHIDRNEEDQITSLSDKKYPASQKVKNGEQTTIYNQKTSRDNSPIAKHNIEQSGKKKNKKQTDVYDKNFIEPPIAEHKKKNSAFNKSEYNDQVLPPVTKTTTPPETNEEKVIDTLSTTTEKKDSTEVKPQTAPPIKASNSIKQKVVKSKTWHWGIQARSGISGISTGLLHLGGSASFDVFAGPTIGSGPAPRPPAPVEKGFSFATGLQVNRKWKERLQFSTGLQYSYFSTHQKVGQNVARDTMIARANAGTMQLNSYYRNDQQSYTHCNSYHFIELPVEISYQLLKRVPLQWHTGISLGRLIDADALVYDRRANLYFKDNSSIRKTQLNMQFALTYTAFKKGKTALLLGPQWQYSLTSLNKEASDRHHLYFLGLKTALSF